VQLKFCDEMTVLVAFRKRTSPTYIHYYGVGIEEDEIANPLFFFSFKKQMKNWKGDVTVLPITIAEQQATDMFKAFVECLEDCEKQSRLEDDVEEDLLVDEKLIFKSLGL
jgi:hypothetical protein